VKRILSVAALAALCAAVAGDSFGAASNYPSPLRLRSTASSVTGSWVLNGGTGSPNTTTGNVSINSASDGGWYVFPPGTASSTRLASITTAPDGTGWIVDPAGGTSGFPAGTWTFTVETSVPSGTLDPATALLTVGMWKGTISGGAFTPVGPALLAPTDDPGSHDLRSGLNVTTSASYSLPKFSLAAGETLFVEFWRHQVDGISDPVAANRTLDLVVNDGTTKIAHPAADSTSPTHALSVIGVSGKTSFKSGTSTLYYRGSGAGSFKVKDTISDAGAGPLQVTYPLVSTSGWTHLAETVTTAPGFTSSTYSWTAGSTTSPGPQSIVAEDKALQTSTATLTLTNDTTGPTGHSVGLSGGPTFSTLSVPLTLVKGTDAGAGVDGASGLVERASAAATSGSCGTFGSWTTVTLTGGADSSVAAGNCYRYRYTISDLLGNVSSPSSPSADAVVDASATSPSPSTASSVSSTATVTIDAPTELSGAGDQYFSGGTLYFRPAGAGSFTLNAAAKSDVVSVTFPDVSTTTGWSGSTGGTDTTSPYSSPVAYTWTAGAAAPGAKSVSATTGGGQTATAPITISADSTPPSGHTIAVGGGPFFATGSVPLTISRGTDAGAGVSAGGDVVERASAPLRNGACGTFGPFAAVTLVNGADTSVAAACYRWRLKLADNVGNVSAASTASGDAKVDSTPPPAPSLLFTGLLNAGADGNVVYYEPSTTGSFTVTAASSDPESGVTTYSFPTIPGFTQAGSGASRTFSFASPVSAPIAPLIVTATNPAGLASAAASFTLVPDPKPPTVGARCNGGPCLAKSYAKPVTVTVRGSDRPGSGVSMIRFTTNGTVPTKDSGFEYTSPFVVRSLVHLRLRAWDRAGNASSPVTLTVRSLADRLVFGAPVRVSVGSADRYLKARVSSTRRAQVLAVMTGPGLKTPGRWRFVLESGAWIVQLRLPETVTRGKSYTVRWTVSAGTRSTSRATQVTLR
jgi:Chitobiase/beta-hexosaminidase C-terminal domain